MSVNFKDPLHVAGKGRGGGHVCICWHISILKVVCCTLVLFSILCYDKIIARFSSSLIFVV